MFEQSEVGEKSLIGLRCNEIDKSESKEKLII